MGSCWSFDSWSAVRDCSADSTPKWTLAGQRHFAKVIHIVDGDTVDVAIELERGKVFQFRTRLYGIDTPEKRPLKSSPTRDQEIVASKRSAEALTAQLANVSNLTTVTFRGADKYGRWLCDLYAAEIHLNDWMILNGYAKSYFGGTKEVFIE